MSDQPETEVGTEPTTEAAPGSEPEGAPEPETPSADEATAESAPVTATVLQDPVSGLWTVDVSIGHGDQTVVRANGRLLWQGTP